MTMTTRKALATAALLPGIATLVFVAGPARWELAYTCDHLIEPSREALPQLTRTLSLPVLGLASPAPGAQVTAVIFWAVIWLGLAALVGAIWRASTREGLVDRFVFGTTLYAGSVALLFALVVVGLVVPFALL